MFVLIVDVINFFSQSVYCRCGYCGIEGRIICDNSHSSETSPIINAGLTLRVKPVITNTITLATVKQTHLYLSLPNL